MKLLANQGIKNFLLCLVVAAITGCASNNDTAQISVKEYKDMKRQLADLKQMKPGLTRLLAVEGDLKELMAVITEQGTAEQQYAASGSNVEVDTIEKNDFKENVVLPIPPVTLAAPDQTQLAQVEIAEEPSFAEPPAPMALREQITAKYFVQLASVTESDSVNPTWEQMKKKNPDLLEDLDLSSEEVNISAKTYYRIKAGPMETMQAARRLCDNLKMRGSNCFTVRG